MPETVRAPARTPAVRSILLECTVCGTETRHRVLRWSNRGEHVEGRARCATCGWTHPFSSAPAAALERTVIVSEGTRSRRGVRTFPPGTLVAVGEPLEGASPPLRVTRLEGPEGRTAPRFSIQEVRTIWTVPDRGPEVEVSWIEGRVTRSFTWSPPEGAVVTVGALQAFEPGEAYVIGFRAAGRTWRRPGDARPAREVDRVYARRIARPPAGSRPWRSERETPRSRASSISRSARSRSGPGVRR